MPRQPKWRRIYECASEEERSSKKKLYESRSVFTLRLSSVFYVASDDERGGICIHRNGLSGATGSASASYPQKPPIDPQVGRYSIQI